MKFVTKNFINDMYKYTTKSFIEIHPCAKKEIFITEFAILGIFMKEKNSFVNGGISK